MYNVCGILHDSLFTHSGFILFSYEIPSICQYYIGVNFSEILTERNNRSKNAIINLGLLDLRTTLNGILANFVVSRNNLVSICVYYADSFLSIKYQHIWFVLRFMNWVSCK